MFVWFCGRPTWIANFKIVGILALLCNVAFAQTTIDQAALSARIDKLGIEIDRDVRDGRLPGAVMLVAQNGKLVQARVFGVQDPNAPMPMPRDAIFRIYSMTKPIVAVAAMMMVEEGKLLLDDPVAKYLPSFADLKVGVEQRNAAGEAVLASVPAIRKMTVRDLLRHTAGLTYGFEGRSMVKDEYKKYRLDGADLPASEWLTTLAKVPLQAQPGSKWEYSIATDVLGVLLERVSGKSLGVLLAERIFRPLGMTDTGFYVEPSKQARIAEPLEIDPVWKSKISLNNVRKTPVRFSGGGGLVSTADDYLRFAQMLLNGGTLDGVRLLSARTVDEMLRDQLAEMRASLPPGSTMTGPRPGYGFGLGFAVRNDIGVANTLGSHGIADWNGLGGTNFWIDPKEKLAVIWMAQAPGLRPHYRQLVPNMLYGGKPQ